MVWKNIHPQDKDNWHRMNEGQRRYAVEQYNLALVRRGLPIDHPRPEISDNEGESEYETAHEESDTETLVGTDDDTQEGYETAVEQDPEEEDRSEGMAPPALNSKGANAVAGPSGTGKGGKSIKRHGTGDSGVGDDGFGLPGTAKDQGGAPSDVPGTRAAALPNPISSIHSNIRYFRKIHRFISWGISYQVIESKLNDVTYRNISTPFAYIPWDRTYFYLNPSEYESLPNQSNIVSVTVTVKPRNVRVAFPTNSSESQLATLNQNKDLCYAIGFNKSIPTINVQYMSFKDAQPMIPLTWELDHKNKHVDLSKDLYGRTWAETPQTVPRHQMGIPTPLPTYAMIPYAQESKEAGYPCLQHHYKDFDADAVTGQTMLKQTYKPLCGLVKKPWDNVHHAYPKYPRDSLLSISRQGGNNMFHKDNIKMDNDNKPATMTSTTEPTWEMTSYAGAYTNIIEASQYIRKGISAHLPVGAQPSIHVAVQPTPALDTKALQGVSNSNFTDTQAYWEVIAECEVNTQYPGTYPLYPGPHGDQNNLFFYNHGDVFAPYTTMYQGLYVSRTDEPE